MAFEWGDLANMGGTAAKMAAGRGGAPSGASGDLAALAEQTGLPIPLIQSLMTDMGPEDDGPSPLEEALARAALEVTGVDLFTYGEGVNLPSWMPKELRQYAQTSDSPLTGVYDPYHGLLSERGDERVYMGSKSKPIRKVKAENVPDVGHESKLYGDAYAEPKGTPTGKKRKKDDTLTYAQAVNLPYTWEDDEVSSAMVRFRKAGVNVRDFDELVAAWGGLVDRASKMYALSLGERKVTPWDVLDLHKREQKAAGSLTDYESGTRTSTHTQVADISEGQSWQVLQATLSQLLGRDPTDRELRDYAYRMNSLAAQNPTITETVTRYQSGNEVASESTTSGGFDAADMAQSAYEQAQDSPEYAKVQAGTTYFNALLQGIGAVGEV